MTIEGFEEPLMLEDMLKQACTDESLCSISVSYTPKHGANTCTVYVHDVSSNGRHACGSGTSATFDDALELAIKNLKDIKEKRDA